jgi:predicted HD phosphohydrolase
MQDAVRLRKYDDLAKIENLEIPNINYFYKHVESSFK